VSYDHFIVGDYMINSTVYNEFSGGVQSPSTSWTARAGFEFPLFNLVWMIEGDFRNYKYQHNSSYPAVPAALCGPGKPGDGIGSCVAEIGGIGSTYVPGFTGNDQDYDARFGLKILDPRIYVAAVYDDHIGNYGYPIENGLGFGLEKLPDLDQTFSLYGSAYYFPALSGLVSSANAPIFSGQPLAYRDLMYQGGFDFVLGKFSGVGVFLDANYTGDSMRIKTLAPANEAHGSAAVGIGLKF